MVNNPFEDVRVTRKDERRFQEIAGTWNHLQNSLNMLSEDDLVKLLRWELDNGRRIHMLNRIKSRHNRIRDQRERGELFGLV